MFLAHAVSGELRGSEEGRVTVHPLDQFPPISPARKGSYRTMQTYLDMMKTENR